MAQKPLSEGLLEIEEIDQANNVVATYIKSPAGEKGERIDIMIPNNANSYVKNVLNVFLPAGYPHSVTTDYLEYQIYDSLQAFSSSIAGMLSSRAVLEGIGVGDSHASPTAALLLSVLQESMGRIATILFAHRLGTSLEPECKMYRLAADVFNDAAMILDCLSPAFPKASRVALLSLSSVLRSLCGVAAGSSKASLSAHFATQGNLGELNAKDSSQETVISLLGMLVGSIVVSHINSKTTTWTALIFLLAIHLGTNYLAVRAVCMRTINRQRANLIFSHILEQISTTAEQVPDFKKRNRDYCPVLDDIDCPEPEKIKLQERVFERDGVLRWRGRVLGYCELGVDLGAIIKCVSEGNTVTDSQVSKNGPTISQLFEVFKYEKYVVWYDEPRKTYLVVLEDGADTCDMLSAWMFALSFAKEGKLADETLLEALKRKAAHIRSIDRNIFQRLSELEWDLDTGAMETRSGVRIRRPKRIKEQWRRS
ncbi:vitamin B6 photo-protection and homoeostasis-domain-containing protein [Rhexocercosporidium sp. MPI-PUGE-AT-0058]|nr:vitamin B6 photo-protection and homoeostasis-domain-containing protein [Rhexocercosporidium sp. MPI-PUGE-AT-0058]